VQGKGEAGRGKGCGGAVYIARVVGNVVSTHKNDRLDGKKLLLVRRLGLDGEPDGSIEVIALDVVDAGPGETVLVVQEGSSARKIFNDERIPVQAVVVGIVESVTTTVRSEK
jgi:ethanolamine utilization protein EutN